MLVTSQIIERRGSARENSGLIDLIQSLATNSASTRTAYERLQSLLVSPPTLIPFVQERISSSTGLSANQVLAIAKFFILSNLDTRDLTPIINAMNRGIFAYYRQPYTLSVPAAAKAMPDYSDRKQRILGRSPLTDTRVRDTTIIIYEWLRSLRAPTVAEPLMALKPVIRKYCKVEELRNAAQEMLRAPVTEPQATRQRMYYAFSDMPQDVFEAALTAVSDLLSAQQRAMVPLMAQLDADRTPALGTPFPYIYLFPASPLSRFRNAAASIFNRAPQLTPLHLPALSPPPVIVTTAATVSITAGELGSRIPRALNQAVISCAENASHTPYTAALLIDGMRWQNEAIMLGVARSMILARESAELPAECAGAIAGKIEALNRDDYQGSGHNVLALNLVQALLRKAEGEILPEPSQKQQVVSQQMEHQFNGNGRISLLNKLAYVIGLVAASEFCGDIEFKLVQEHLQSQLSTLTNKERAWIDIHAKVEEKHAQHALDAVNLFMKEMGHNIAAVQNFWRGFDDFCKCQTDCYVALGFNIAACRPEPPADLLPPIAQAAPTAS